MCVGVMCGCVVWVLMWDVWDVWVCCVGVNVGCVGVNV